MSSDQKPSAAGPETPKEESAIFNKERQTKVEAGKTVDRPSDAANFVEGVEAVESAEVSGEVSDIMKKQGEDGKGGSSKKSVKRVTPAQIKAQLLHKAPSEGVMKSQIKREINKEVRYLHRRANRIMRKPGRVNAFELNNVVKKIRELRILLLSLAKAVVNTTRTLWLRFVHGVM